MRETVRLIISGLKDISQSLSKPVRFAIMWVIISTGIVLALLSCVIYWQRGDINTYKAEIKEMKRVEGVKDIRINGLEDKLCNFLLNLNAETKLQLEELKRSKK